MLIHAWCHGCVEQAVLLCLITSQNSLLTCTACSMCAHVAASGVPLKSRTAVSIYHQYQLCMLDVLFCMWAAGERCQGCASVAAEPDTRPTWHRQNCYQCHLSVPAGQARPRPGKFAISPTACSVASHLSCVWNGVIHLLFALHVSYSTPHMFICGIRSNPYQLYRAPTLWAFAKEGYTWSP